MKFRRDNVFLLLLSLILLLVASLLTTACEPVAPIKVRNGTSETLTIFINDVLIGEVAPQSEIKNDFAPLSTAEYTIIAKDPNGDVIYQELFTHRDLDRLKWRVHITSSGSP